MSDKKNELREQLDASRERLKAILLRVGNSHPDTAVELAVMGGLLGRAGHWSKAMPQLEAAWSLVKSTANSGDIRMAKVAEQVARGRLQQGDHAGSVELLELAYGIRSQRDDVGAGLIAAQLGELYLTMGKASQALPMLEQGLTWYQERYGTDHKKCIARIRLVAAAAKDAGDYSRAAIALRALLSHLVATGAESRAIASVAFQLSKVLHHLGAIPESRRNLERALDLTRADESLHKHLPARLTVASERAKQRQELEMSWTLLLEAYEVERRLYGDVDETVARRSIALGRFAVALGRDREAVGWLESGVVLLSGQVDTDDSNLKKAAGDLIELLTKMARRRGEAGDRQEARALIEMALAHGNKLLGRDHTVMRPLLILSRNMGI